MKHKISLISRKIAEDGKNVSFTGAGISTESEIPDYRSRRSTSKDSKRNYKN
jgi:NAD-dependent SIR2 family protein deacetylase|tara:strand:- start:307 stop:462 length:156 start_codon:yes stop_codon:yes gene_type:complete